MRLALRGVAAGLTFLGGIGSPLRAEDQPTGWQPFESRAFHDRERAEWPALPEFVRQAFVAAEDRYFFDNLAHRSVITLYLAKQRGTRGSVEALARTLELGTVLGHDEILDWFVHTVYFGRRCFGVDGAAMAYFGKPPTKLAVQEAALLAALVKAPAQFQPDRDPDRALERRNFVLGEMVQAGFLDTTEAAKALPLGVIEPLSDCARQP